MTSVVRTPPRSHIDPAPAPANGRSDWRTRLPEGRRRHLRAWYASGAALTFLILVIGGITRLTQSGLSIVDWAPIMGAIPPIGEREWMEAFARYQQFPEYQQLRVGMTLAEFKFIYFWEYIHRLAARLIGVVFLIPFLYFLVRGYFSRPLLVRTVLLFLLGGMQGFVGWFMVRSGLEHSPAVSHYRLAAHLSIALAILCLCMWLRWELRASPGAEVRRGGETDVGVRPTAAGVGDGDAATVDGGARDGLQSYGARPSLDGAAGTGGAVGATAGAAHLPAKGEGRWIAALGVLLLLQILWGAFVAGLDAGLAFNTFPLMADRLVPPNAWGLEPVLRNLVENPATVQWVHRVLGTVLTVVAALAAWRLWGSGGRDVPGSGVGVSRAVDSRGAHRRSLVLLGLIVAQYGLGVLTLLWLVPVSLGVLHQAAAAVILVVWLEWAHAVSRGRARVR